MKRKCIDLLVVATLATVVAVGYPAGAEESDGDLPTAVFVAVPEAGDIAGLLESGRRTCSTTALPPNELDPTDLRNVTATTEATCGEGNYVGVVSSQFLYLGDGAAPTGAGVRVGLPATSEGELPLVATARLNKFTLTPGWYKTVGRSQITYPFKLDTRRAPGQGCRYLSTTQIECSVASSAVHVETLRWLNNTGTPSS